MTDKPFPYQEIRRKSGDFFHDWQDAKNHGHADNCIWSVTEYENTICYGPPHHYVNLIGHIATKETHNNDEYYEETYK